MLSTSYTSCLLTPHPIHNLFLTHAHTQIQSGGAGVELDVRSIAELLGAMASVSARPARTELQALLQGSGLLERCENVDDLSSALLSLSRMGYGNALAGSGGRGSPEISAALDRLAAMAQVG